MMAVFVKRIKAKLKSNRGESLTEVLVAILVSGMATLMLAMGISVSANMNFDSREAISNYYETNKKIVEGESNVETTGKATVTLKSKEENAVKTSTYSVEYAMSEQNNGKTIVPYEAEASSSSGNQSATSDNQSDSGDQDNNANNNQDAGGGQ